MRTGIIARKLGMTRVFTESGAHVPVTVLQLDGCQVTAVRTQEKDGYTAVQLGSGSAKVKRVSKAERERFAKGFIEHLLAYASAREVSPADRQSVLAVVEQTKAQNFPMRDVITELILSPAFLGSSDGKESIK